MALHQGRSGEKNSSPSHDTVETLSKEVAAGSWLLLLLALVVLSACLLWLRQRRGKHDRSAKASRPEPGDIEQRIAGQLEAEILRRTASSQDGGA